MEIFYYSDHGRHDPALLHGNQARQVAYYVEVAQRGDLIHAAVQAAELGRVRLPEDFGQAPLLAVHTPELLELLSTAYGRLAAEAGAARPVIPDTYLVGEELRRRPETVYGLLGWHCFDTSSPIFERTWEVAYWSAQCALSAAANVYAGAPQAYALCRPPGHHAGADRYGGFCYLNNVAVAARWLGDHGARVAILDVDYHHGNGTQSIFYADPNVLTVSVHADPLVEYPYFWGHADEIGTGPGTGFNLNLPLPLGTVPAGYFPTLEQGLQAVERFAPDALLVSLGVDTFEGDPAGGFRLDTAAFARIGSWIAALGYPTVVVQEGGYRLSHLGLNVVTFLQALMR